MPKKKPPSRKSFQVKLTDAEKRVFNEAAAREHLTLSAWMRVAAHKRATNNKEKS